MTRAPSRSTRPNTLPHDPPSTHAHAQLAPALVDAVGEHAVRPDSGQEQRDDAEGQCDEHWKPAADELPVDPLLHRALAKDRHLRIDAGNRPPDAADELRRLTACLDDDRRSTAGLLFPWKVDDADRRPIGPWIEHPDFLDHPDNRQERLLRDLRDARRI
jgi:hypothetical protein